jgi:selenide,water dikinase
VLVGRESFDDAGVFVLRDDLALVQTVDFFAPIVDDPYDFGQIAAANALSDVFAMGGEPLTALAIVGFPAGKLPMSVLTDILRGAQDKVREAGATLVGGHSIIDEELKFGLSVTGQADPRRLLTNAAARPGDVLVLTKPLGTGLLATAAKQDRLDDAGRDALYASMRSLNALASRAALAANLRCATDVTGFGLLGHALEMARGSGLTAELSVSAAPLLPGVEALAQAGVRTGASTRNWAGYGADVDGAEALSDWRRDLMTDPQTSGGLLIAVAADRADAVLDLVRREGFGRAAVVGRMAQGPARVRVNP